MNYYFDAFRKYATFNGRTTRKEYWMFVLFHIIVAILLSIVDTVIGADSILVGLYGLAAIIPILAIAVRRLHDTNRSGWWLLINGIPLIGAIVMFVFTVQKGTVGDNKYGASSVATSNPVPATNVI